MKIKRFKLFEKLSDDVFGYVDDFKGRVDFSVFDWIGTVAKGTKLKEYSKLSMFNPKFIKEKNFRYIEKYLNIENEIFKKQNEINKLENSKEKLEIEASNEALYKFQEELLDKDFDSFYRLFIDGFEEDEIEEGTETIWDVHPEIFKKYEKQITLKLSAKKYNL